jgi:hypothetical protein
MATMIRCGIHWTARIVVDIGPAAQKRVVTPAVAIDVGLTTLATLLDATEVENPRWTRNTGVGRDRVWRGTFSPPYCFDSALEGASDSFFANGEVHHCRTACRDGNSLLPSFWVSEDRPVDFLFSQYVV